MSCDRCGRSLDCWELLLGALRDRSDLWHGISFAGGRTLFGSVTIRKGEAFHLSLEPYGVPANSRLIRVGNTPQNFLNKTLDPVPSPLMMLALLQARPGAPILGNELTFWPVEFGPAPHSDWEQCDVALHVVWSNDDLTDTSWKLLRSSLTAYADGDSVRAILDAVNAVDRESKSALTPLLRIDSYNPETSLGSIAHRLALAKALARAHSVQTTHPRLLPLIQKLNGTRNREGVAHPGKLSRPADEVAEMLAAALATSAYFEAFPALLAR